MYRLIKRTITLSKTHLKLYIAPLSELLLYYKYNVFVSTKHIRMYKSNCFLNEIVTCNR